MAKFNHVDLCSGIGGFSLGFEWAGLSQPILFCDIEPWARRILKKHWPDVPIAEDVKELANDPETLIPGRIDILTAGYPCQPFSVAGHQRGTEDARHIYTYISRIVARKRRTWCVFENVYGHVSLGLDEVLNDMESQGYATRPFIVGASAVGAPHKRDRLWIIARNMAYTDGKGLQRKRGSVSEPIQEDDAGNNQQGGTGNFNRNQNGEPQILSQNAEDVADTKSERYGRGSGEERGVEERSIQQGEQGGSKMGGEVEGRSSSHGGKDVADPNSKRGCSRYSQRQDAGDVRQSPGSSWHNTEGMGIWSAEPNVGRVAHGVPKRVDRLKGLGNAIVPQIAQKIGETIMKIEGIHNG